MYEITRVCLHVGVSFAEIDFPEPAVLDDYTILWRFLKSVPALEGKLFLERCSETIWELASGDFSHGFRGVVFSGSLRFNIDGSGKPLFHFRLLPMKLDLSHRLGRRFMDDRFLEIDMPALTGRDIPKSLRKVGARGYDIVCNWLVGFRHPLLGRFWKPFLQRLFVRRRNGSAIRTNQKWTRSHFRIGSISLLLTASRLVYQRRKLELL